MNKLFVTHIKFQLFQKIDEIRKMILFQKNIKNSLTISERDGNMTKFSEMRQSHVEESQKNWKKVLDRRGKTW